MKKAILVLGPPRSGTSAISNVIHKLGVDFGSHDRFVDPQTHTYNPIFFELQSLNDLNDEMFSHFARTFANFDWMPDENDFDDAVMSKFAPKIETFIKDEFHDSNTVGLKDPRFCFTLPIWDVVLKRLGFGVHYVMTRRLSRSVFESNQGLNGFPSEVNFRVVALSAILASYFVAGKPHVVIRYEDLLENQAATVASLCDGLGLDRALVADACSVVRKELNHKNAGTGSLLYNYFDRVIDSDAVLPDEYVRYREICWAAPSDKDRKIASLNETVRERGEELARLNQTLNERNGEIARLERAVQTHSRMIDAYRNSLSWRITGPLRFMRRQIRQARQFLSQSR